ncbi:hypothetical protein M2152_000858 [Microbacteriaceae bacterium SG_E_30_P1]|uniref:Tetratricopeptide repeat protein n=1 Tax=Antiquaquibacter oligotrophicus TaxID=2880260 RepID=A0ABT6KL20_9MICO|nr:hypothetical protein [Antiquaquibacter oligotrophicus]MDH6180676.1 hypothetical protein [Antiquaquibacter oligotrophicus]UDF13597.1 hypothetical protein LH407_01725 [Antiquaquibacter oligotrophicus]
MISRISAVVMAVLLVLYLVVVTQYAIALLGSGDGVAVAMGAALIVLPLVGAWALISEVIFVSRAQRLVARLGDEGGLPVDDLPRLPSGRIDARAADLEFPVYKAAVEANPESWRDWLRLGLAYDASADRRRARWSVRRAIALERRQRPAR